MKRTLKVLAAVFVFAILVFTAVPAYSATFTTVKVGATVTVPEETARNYKIVAPDTGFITMSVVGDGLGMFLLEKPNDLYGGSLLLSGYRFGVEKGRTYYISVYNSYGSKTQRQFRTSFTKYSIGANYCRAKAKTISLNNNVYVISSPNYQFIRWYKIKTTKRQRISVYTYKDAGCGYTGIDIIDSKGKKLQIETDYSNSDKASSANRTYTYSTQPAGTYYIRMDDGDEVTNLVHMKVK